MSNNNAVVEVLFERLYSMQQVLEEIRDAMQEMLGLLKSAGSE